MKTEKKISQRLLFWISLWGIIILALIFKIPSWDPAPAASAIYDFFVKTGAAEMTKISWSPEKFQDVFLRASLILFVFLAGILLWIFQRASVRRILAGKEPSEGTENLPEAAVPQESTGNKRKKERDDRLKTLHLFSLLQRKGRLADFLEENMEGYDDAQIGAAVRDIHGRCKKILHEHLSLEAVMDGVEGEEVTIPAGFDPDAIKLTGNVSGKPPFKGILQHRGWRVIRLELPAVSGDKNPDIIAPAEVEIT